MNDVDPATGEGINPNIITMMWENNINLMELLSQKYSYRSQIESMNREYYAANPLTLDERMSEMYIPSAVRRPVKRTIEMMKEYTRTHRLRQQGKTHITTSQDPARILQEVPAGYHRTPRTAGKEIRR